MKHILRYYIPLDKARERLNDVVSYCKKTGCREVLLFTTSYRTMPSFIPLREVENYSSRMIEWAEILRSEGIEVSVNVLQTLGHICFPKELSQEFPFQRQVTFEGKESHSSACPLDKNLQEYLLRAYKYYARVKPRILFVDDDFRFITGGGMGCFCPLHLTALEKHLGRKVTLEELRSFIFSPSFHPDPVRKAFHQVLNESLVNLARLLGEAVREVSPKTRVGLMSSIVPHSLWGCDIDKVIHAFAGDLQPLYRPQMPMYEEIELKLLPRCFSQPAVARNLLSRDVELYPEIENDYYTVFAKSARVTFLQMAGCLLNGMDNLALDIFDILGNPLAEGEEIIEMLAQRQHFFQALRELVPIGTRARGIGILLHKESPVVRRPLSGEPGPAAIIDPRHWDNYIPLLGLPLGFDWEETPFIFLTGDDILAFKKEEIDSILSRGAVMDIRAAECLCHLGYSERIGIRVKETLNLEDDLYVEHFKDYMNFHAQWGGSYEYFPYRAREFVLSKKIETVDRRAKILSAIEHRSGRKISPAVVCYENVAGERFGILAYSPEKYPGARNLFLNPRRKAQLRNLFSWVARKELPAAVINAPYVQPIYISLEDKIILGLMNFSTDVYEEIILSLPGLAGKKFAVFRLNEKGKREDITDRVKKRERAGEKCFSLQLTFIPASLNVLIFEL